MNRILSVAVAALPFAFGIIRAIQTRHDGRAILLAFVSGASGALALVLLRRIRPHVTVRGAVARALVVLVVATFVGGLVAGAMTRMSSAGAWALAFFFALCFAGSTALGST